MNKQNFLQLISLITVQVCALRHRLEELTKYNFPSEGPKKLAEIFIKSCYVFLRILCKLGNDVENKDVEVNFALFDLYIIVRMTQSVAKYLRFIESAQTKYVPIEIVAPIEQLVKNISPEARVIIRPQSSYTYDYREIMVYLRSFFENLKKIVPFQEIQQIYIKYPKEIPILNFPTIARENIFSLAALGHEIGHFVYDKNKENSFEKISLPENYDKRVDAIIAEENKIEEKVWLRNVQDNRYEFREDIHSKFSEITKISRAWFKELISDIMGVRIFGPASFFSFTLSGLAIYPLDYDPISLKASFEKYPSPRKRLNFMFKEIEHYFCFPKKYKNRYGKLIEKFNKTKEKYENIIKTDEEEQRLIGIYTIEKPGTDKYVKLLNDIVFPAVEKIKTEKIDKIIEKYEYKPQVFHSQIFELYEKLEKDILPNEILKNSGKNNEPACWISILNAGYLYYLTDKKFISETSESSANGLLDRLDEYSSEELFYQKQELSRFILRAIEVSEIHRRFIDEKKQT